MKICILSMQRVHNYGSFLQAYGLRKLLEHRGHSVSFIDIKPGEREENHQRRKVNIIKFMNENLDRYIYKKIRYRKINYYVDQMFKEAQSNYLGINEVEYNCKDADAIVIGSDEVFNCNIKNPWGISMQLYGEIDLAPIITSYAASCGYTSFSDVPERYQSRIGTALANMKAISVRDTNTYEFVRKLTGKEAEINLDPVLIYEFDEEIKEAENRTKIPQNYMIVYAYRNRINDPQEIRRIVRYAKAQHLKTICLGGSLPWCDEFPILDPFQVLAYFKHAKCIVTDTFHGTIMSVKFHKPVAIIVRDSNRNKLCDLVERLEIQNHVISNFDHIEEILSSDDSYSRYDKIIAAERIHTEQYFLRSGF